jgi:hypothetical protein
MKKDKGRNTDHIFRLVRQIYIWWKTRVYIEFKRFYSINRNMVSLFVAMLLYFCRGYFSVRTWRFNKTLAQFSIFILCASPHTCNLIIVYIYSCSLSLFYCLLIIIMQFYLWSLEIRLPPPMVLRTIFLPVRSQHGLRSRGHSTLRMNNLEIHKWTIHN